MSSPLSITSSMLGITPSPKLGPLATTNFAKVSDLAAAVELATGPCGWWTIPTMNESLTNTLLVYGVTLIPSETFDISTYCRLREEHGGITRVNIENGRISQLPLPQASTAKIGKPGLICLRALTAGILCLYSTRVALWVLEELVPPYLCEKDTNNGVIAFDGLQSLCLERWVHAVAAEEACDKSRQYLLRSAEYATENLGDVPREAVGDMSSDFPMAYEIECIRGVLQYTLTPLSKRQSNNYPTRCLRALLLAEILNELGFKKTYARTEVVQDITRYEEWLSEFSKKPGAGLILVTDFRIHHDFFANELPTTDFENEGCAPLLRPQVMPMREVPSRIFGMFLCQTYCLGPERIKHLSVIWEYAFRSSRALFRQFEFQSSLGDNQFHVRLHEANPDDMLIHTRSVLNIFCIPQTLLRKGGLRTLCAAAIQKYIAIEMDDERWNSDWFGQGPEWIAGDWGSRNFAQEVFEYLCLQAAVLGALYGICSNAIISTHDHGKGVEAALDTKVAVQPDMAYAPDSLQRLKGWAATIERALTSEEGIDSMEWHTMLRSMFLGTFDTPDSDRAILGAKANGLFIISDFVVHPSIRPDSSLYVHLMEGQPLTLSTSKDGYVLASHVMPQASIVPVPTSLRTQIIKTFDTFVDAGNLSVEVKPDWGQDAGAIYLEVCLQGKLKARIDLQTLISRVQSLRTSCTCASKTSKALCTASVLQVPMQDILNNLPDNVLAGSQGNNILIDASSSENTSLLAIGALALDRYHSAIASDCMLCALAAVTKAWNDNVWTSNMPAAIVIPWERNSFRERVVTHGEDPRLVDPPTNQPFELWQFYHVQQ